MPASRAHHAVGRVDAILDLVARAPEPPTLTGIATALGLPRSTVADLLRELREHGYVRRTGHRYRLGFRAHVLGRLAGVGAPSRIDHARLAELSRVARTPLALAVLVGAEVLYLDSAGPRAPARLQRVVDDHRPRPALRTAAGRLLLACAGEAERAVALRAMLDDADGAADGAAAVAAFERERPAIEHAGLARSDGVADPDMRALALPVVEDGAVAAALVLFAPLRGPASALEQAARRVRERLAGT